MQVNFAGKVAIVTGGASGMGAALVRIIIESHGKVVIADVDQGMGTKLAQELGEGALFVRTDVTRDEDAQALAGAAVAAFGRIDILFNNAGVGHGGDAGSITPDEWRRIIDVNLNSAFVVARAVLPHLKAAGGGSIVNTCSVSGIGGDYGMLAYNAAKGGLINLTRALALDCAADNIRVNAVCPGVIGDTAMTAHLRELPGALNAYNARIPMRRTGAAVEVARVMAFVASDLASYMTGSVTVVDGGLTAHTGLPTLEAMAAATDVR
jgi:meso-butanediol dehydrogenase/(S,S)-butanediol dehydrogenase/diacetyl reductase